MGALIPLLSLNLIYGLQLILNNYKIPMQSKLTLAVHIITLIIEQARRSFTCLKDMKFLMIFMVAMARIGLWMSSISLLIRFYDKGINFWMDALMLAYGIMNLIPLFCVIPLVFIVD